VPVKGHRRHAQAVGKAADRHGLEAAGVAECKRFGEEGVAREP
jgi:hypothetical protein